ncbi:hypothetical protein B5807_09242 [Epicoccum nigrum]|uniref:Uncharacterized protein n=1 Tax=Epicoccum nigrum TaxID=105696 RepID=A0A1Y2LQM1_EPING|nr:hypothetical protein B5807_09242 [Epicoccum nigrum]
MCQYWKKLHTCTHQSDWRYIEMCHQGFISNTVCKDIATTEPGERQSHFPCWVCIKTEARAELMERIAQEQAEAEAAEAAREQAARYKAENDKRVREERVRREAREKADRERAAEMRVRAEREAEREKARKEGGAWTVAESHGGRKKNKGRGSVPNSPSSLSTSFPMGPLKKDAWKENSGKTSAAWGEGEKATSVSGRAGVWPPPRKILSRKEGAAGVLGNRPDGQGDGNGKK